MSLSRSQGALGQGGAGRSTLAILNTRDDGAPHLRSEKMSPKWALRDLKQLSPGKHSPRWVHFSFYACSDAKQFQQATAEHESSIFLYKCQGNVKSAEKRGEKCDL